MESRVYHNKPLTDGWVAIAEYCLDLAKCRYFQGKDIVYSTKSRREVQLAILEHEILNKNRAATLAKAHQKMPAPILKGASSSKEHQ